MTESAGTGTLFVLSAPSGTGKSSVVRRLLETTAGLRFSVSYTTRPRRAGERDGREYHFVSDERFDRMDRDGSFLESARVHAHRYGTGRAATEEILAAGCDVLLDVDVQGARRVRESGVAAVFLFLLPPSYEALESRLRSRASDTEEQVRRRLAAAREEAREVRGYDYAVINEDLERAVSEVRSIVVAERCRTTRRSAATERILRSFPGMESTEEVESREDLPEE